MKIQRSLAVFMAVMMLMVCLPSALAEEKPDTWIADRTITIQAYVDDIGYSLPKDLMGTPTMQKIKELTGISMDVRYTPGDDDATVMASQLAAGNIPDVICCYLNNSTRPEFPIILKAAKEGMFTDLTEMMKNSKVYSHYMEEDYLPVDAKNNIVFRDDLDGVYLIQLDIPAVDRSTEYVPDDEYVGGLFIRSDIAEALDLDVTSIRTLDQFYDLLVAIKEGDFKDDNGNSIYPLGPRYWGGSVESLEYVLHELYISPFVSDYGMTADSHIIHEAETDAVYKKIDYVRTLLDEDLMHPEFFTMDPTRAEELCSNKGIGVIADIHNYVDLVTQSDTWIPLGPLNDCTGANCNYVSGKTGYGAWAISAEAENPEEIFAFFDWMASYEGQLTCEYGVEGLSYNMVDGYPVLTDEVQAKLNEGDTDWLINEIGAGFGGQGNYVLSFFQTNTDPAVVFGESRPGAKSGTVFARAVELANEYPREKVLVPGLDIAAYLSTDAMSEVKANLDLLNYEEMLAQAMYADSEDDVTAIVESFRAQLKSAGIDQFYEYVEGIYAEEPESIQIIPFE